MTPIATTFTERPFRYTQIERQGDIAIYCQEHASGATRYEVVRIRVQPAHTWPHGGASPEREVYPGSRRWGIDGWTFHTLSAAQAHAATLARPPAPAPEPGVPLVVCACGTVVLRASTPLEHTPPARQVHACGVCTATGGQPEEGAPDIQ